ncbi:hypothetical protein Ahy_B01g056406 [Arachis hypogaea]|uniref:Aminotransferase-like plant mobile domain-containing protein n=1 Tax=Arachis hypogaea TaxID=3818 RepID=A0A445AYV1_ARAHY|nr:hypothetical protein Ahy_B01g056406 [Arachis hypogaea]
MPMHERIIPYLERAGLYHLARLNSQWFWLDESLVSAFVERWRLEMHTFHMPFGECTLTLQDVAFQLGLPVDGEAVSGCLAEFEKFMEVLLTRGVKNLQEAEIPAGTAPNGTPIVENFSRGMGMESEILPRQARGPERGSLSHPR